ncbi:MAG: hypothetical protein AB7G93_06400 [Bdellovibrionales bacterium]
MVRYQSYPKPYMALELANRFSAAVAVHTLIIVYLSTVYKEMVKQDQIDPTIHEIASRKAR